ncbi:Protein of unknown function UPF0125 [Nitrosococcus oceani ATCC 19707]|uniref:Uncharacterized protein n=3 Tax=Nitrosococcus oceani TaxID=1229 RepID=Q3JBU8_NITOC|nr:Protein of unknown function UPF0125 [Nitrosococcus oceani ATCC 19707]EDZ68341.1 conserved hypothetical protein [Nitrosococcus oceani AFC27]KFI19867.1 RnfH [Nitrosococcus oceani C-27]KFI23022.1 RnfH [Nitrosococcus oceani]GEM19348.1 RnfH family protein [Nitrosococcus oceani]
MASVKMMTVEVAYARPDKQVILKASVPENTTLEAAIQASGILEQFPEIDLDKNKVGIFGKLSKRDAPLCFGNRIEIYRPLIADPKQARRERATKARQAK